ncbi:MAG: tRNA pseudouridine(38-40) synthase TruA [Bacteroidota bacterium]
MATLILRLEYDGSSYHGWQSQPDMPNIQDKLESAIEKLTGRFTRITGAGRTDTGVHARGQVATMPLHDGFTIPEDKIPIALNSNLPPDIKITDAQISRKEINARFDAAAREYEYLLSADLNPFLRKYLSHYKYPFDPELLNEAAQLFLGTHDFSTYSKHNPEVTNHTCNLQICFWDNFRDDIFQTEIFRLQIKADRFLFSMVRALAGAMLDHARGKVSLAGIKEALEAKNRNMASPLAPPQGLYLKKVYYPENLLTQKI